MGRWVGGLPGEEAEEDVSVEIPLMGLVENEDGVLAEEEIAADFL